jgi:RimJ/RimL family protein N-acetyltransferase
VTKTREESELEIRRQQDNYPGFAHPLTCRPLKISDTALLAPVMKKSAPYIKGYISWGTYASRWTFADVQRFVSDRVNDDFPRFHLLFFIGNKAVALGSLAPMPSPLDIQISLVVFHPYQGIGLGKRVVKTLEWYAFEVWGYQKLFYQYDATNKNSQKLANFMGFEFSHSFDDIVSAEKESGLWFSHVKERPEDLPDGVFQGADIEYWTQPRNEGLLEAVINAREDGAGD